MNRPFWNYETSIGNTINVSVRSAGTCTPTEYYLFLAKFICAHQDRIIEIRDVSKPSDKYCCIILMSGREYLNFESFRFS